MNNDPVVKAAFKNVMAQKMGQIGPPQASYTTAELALVMWITWQAAVQWVRENGAKQAA